jgi:PAS domain S-box-containing protein
MIDITEQKRIEEQLRGSESRSRALVEHIPAVTYREALDANPADFYISPQVETVFGHDPKEWTWTPGFWRDHLHPQDRDRALGADRRSNETGEPYREEYRLRTSDGSYVWVSDHATLVRVDEGTPYWQGFMLDITERKHAEEAMQTAEARYQALVEQVPAAIYTQVIEEDGTTNTTFISPQAEDMLGYTVQETLSDPGMWRRMLHPDDLERVLSEDEAGNATGEPFAMEYRMIAKDGRVVWIRDEATAVVGPEGRPQYWQGFMLDITERKQAEEQLEHALDVEREATRKLRALDEMKNTFLQAVSHDLRTPLAAILGLAVTLERSDLDLAVDDTQDLAKRIATNARKLDRMVTDLLDLDRLARGIVEPKLHPTDVGALVRRVAGESDLMGQGRIEVDAPPIVVSIDASKVERIVENLLANTARHTPAGTRVDVRVEHTEDGVIICVEDRGPGVPPDLREAIFEAFRQGPQASPHSPGVGVGLALVARFAELQGGRAWVEEREGGGASFRVFLADGPSSGARVGTAG